MIADDYIRKVQQSLRDLPWSVRRDLIADLRRHLAELPEGSDRVARFGTPESYAAELRAAAGLERRHGLRAYLRARRPRNLVIGACVVLAIGFAITAVVYVDSYQPLADFEDARMIVRGGDPRPTPGGAGYTVSFQEGRPFRWGIPIVNDGPFAVRVLGVTGAPPFLAGHLFMAKRIDDYSDGPFEAFRPFDLQPGSFRWLVFQGVFACNAGGTDGQNEASARALPVRYRFHWRTATAEIPLAQTLTFSFHAGGCLPTTTITVEPPTP